MWWGEGLQEQPQETRFTTPYHPTTCMSGIVSLHLAHVTHSCTHMKQAQAVARLPGKTRTCATSPTLLLKLSTSKQERHNLILVPRPDLKVFTLQHVLLCVLNLYSNRHVLTLSQIFDVFECCVCILYPVCVLG